MRDESLDQIREKIARGLMRKQDIKALSLDHRAGARALADRLEREQQARLREKRRLRAMLKVERELWQRGTQLVAGVDEVGAGPLAGPVLAAAVILPVEFSHPGINDSKVVTPAQRQELSKVICQHAVAFAYGICEPREIDSLNIYQASRQAMRRAVLGLRLRPQHVLVDARTIPNLGIDQTALKSGDAVSLAIAAASIIAKVKRDALMERYAKDYPEYGFERHRGYGTAAHLRALQTHGPTPIHRMSFAPVRAAATEHHW